MEFQWSEKTYDMKTFVKYCSTKLPIIVSVIDGFYGIDDDDEYTFSNGDEYRLTHLNKQDRIIVKDTIGRHISIPVKHPLRFHLLDDNEQKGEARSLTDLANKLYKDDKIIDEEDDTVDFWEGVDKKVYKNLGQLTYVAEYQERYLVGNTLTNGDLEEEPVVIPVYVSIKVVIAEKLQSGSLKEFDQVKQNWAHKSIRFKNHLANGNLEIMLFEGKISDYTEYDYVRPLTFLRTSMDLPKSGDENVHLSFQGVDTPAGDSLKDPESPYMLMLPRAPLPPPQQQPKSTKHLSTVSTVTASSQHQLQTHIEEGNHSTGNNETADTEKYSFMWKQNSNLQGVCPKPKPPPPPPKPEKRLKINCQGSVPLTRSSPSSEQQLQAATEANPDSPKQVCLVQPTKPSSASGAIHRHCIGELRSKLPLRISTAVPTNRPKQVDEQNPSRMLTDVASNRDPSSVVQSSSYLTLPSSELTYPASTRFFVTMNPSPVLNIPVPQQERIVPTIDKPKTEAEEIKNITTQNSLSNIKEVKTMTIEEVGEVLDLLHLSEYKELFKEQRIDGALLYDITVDDLIKDFKFGRIQAKKLIKCVKENWRPHTNKEI